MINLNHLQISYAGFWRRLSAFLLDTLIFSLISTALMIALYGIDHVMKIQTMSADMKIDWNLLLIDQLVPAVLTVAFWIVWKATPGKLLFDCQVVDADTFQKASVSQLLQRYLCYIISALPLGLGFLWIAFNKRSQGWHDKLSNTVVIMQDASLAKLESYA